MSRRSIIHLDMDAFYTSVEQRDNPELRGKPVIVGGSVRRGVVSAASYEVRKFGVHSAMPMARAVKLCPQAIVLPVRMSRYQEVSEQVFEIFHRYTPLVEPLSLDEAFLDVSASEALFGPAVEIAQRIRAEVRAGTGLTVSAGVAPNKFLAKIASDLNKPDGLTCVDPGAIEEFLAPLPVSKIWGVGRETEQALHRLGIRTIGDLRKYPLQWLSERFGRSGEHFFELARGIDDRPVEPGSEAKSVGHEDTYDEDLRDLASIETQLLDLADRVAARLRRDGLKGGTITLKVKYADFTMITRSVTPGFRTDDAGMIHGEVLRLLRKTECGRRPVRLLGVSLSGLVSADEQPVQPGLFLEDARDLQRQRLNATVDRIRDRFGRSALVSSRLLSKPDPAGENPSGERRVRQGK